MADWRRIVRAFVHEKTLEGLYAERRAESPQTGNRTRLTVALASAILLLLVVNFLAAMHLKESPREYLAKRNRLAVLENDAFRVEVSAPVPRSHCGTLAACRAALAGGLLESVPLTALAERTNPFKEERAVALVRFPVTRAQLGGLTEFLTITLSVPGLQYYRGEIFVNGVFHRAFFLNRRIYTVLEPTSLPESSSIEVVLELNAAQPALAKNPTGEPVFVATQHEFEAFVEHLAVQDAGRGQALGLVATVVLAVFVLLLFLIVDGSPESLGLALAMGFEAVYIVVHENWLSLDWLGGRLDIALRQYLLVMAAIFKIYFCAQLARFGKKSVRTWFLAGSAIALPLAALRYYASNKLTSNTASAYWTSLDLAVAALAFAICLRGFISVWGRDVPWRRLALALATFATAFMVARELGNLGTILSGGAVPAWLLAPIKVLAPNAPFLFVLSAFVNISTLENRVRSLSESAVKAKEIEQDLTLGRVVQETLHRVAPLPAIVALETHFDPMSYVSGDTYFVDWHEASGRLTVVLNDVTGHGMQAALKAAACNSMALAFWDERRQAGGEGAPRFDDFYEIVQHYYDRHGDTPDVTAITAVALDTRRGILECYRANYLSPVIVEHRDGVWGVAMPTLANRKTRLLEIPPGAFVLLLSDGVLCDVALARNFPRLLRAELARVAPDPAALDVQRLLALILGLPALAQARKLDDRTVLAFQWRPTTDARQKSEHGQLPAAA